MTQTQGNNGRSLINGMIAGRQPAATSGGQTWGGGTTPQTDDVRERLARLEALLTSNWTPPALSLTLIRPTTGSIDGGTSVTLTGTGFTISTAVFFGNKVAASVHFASATTITAITPPSFIGAVDVRVTDKGQTAVLARAFTYAASPLDEFVSWLILQPFFAGLKQSEQMLLANLPQTLAFGSARLSDSTVSDIIQALGSAINGFVAQPGNPATDPVDKGVVPVTARYLYMNDGLDLIYTRLSERASFREF